MKKLETTITNKHFIYKLHKRNDRVAWYKQYSKESGDFLSNEVFKVLIMPEKEMFGKVVPEREKYPADADFGITAKSTRYEDKAENYYNSI